VTAAAAAAAASDDEKEEERQGLVKYVTDVQLKTMIHQQYQRRIT